MQLTRLQSMTRAYEFAGVRERGISSAGRFLVLSVLEDPSMDTSKFGIICTKKVGKAHLRNKLRRRMREILRAEGDCYGKGHFVVTVLRWRSAEASFEELSRDWQRAARRLKRGEGRTPEDRKKFPPRGKGNMGKGTPASKPPTVSGVDQNSVSVEGKSMGKAD